MKKTNYFTAAPFARPTALTALLLFYAGSLAGAEGDHFLKAEIAYGKEVYTQLLRLPEGSQANYVGPVKSRSGKEKQIILNGLIVSGGKEPVLQYQFELSSVTGVERSIQAQSEVALTPGESLPALECGPWSLTLTLDPPKTGGIKKTGKTWNAGSLSNYRLTASLSAGKSKQTCRIISMLGVQSNAVDSVKKDGKKYGFILNSLFSAEGIKPGVRLQYQMDFNAGGPGSSVALQNEISLTLNKKTPVPGEDYKLELLLEGQEPAKRRAAGAANSLQHRCFCIQYTGKAPPYFIAKILSSPGCEKMEYAPSGEEPTRELLACEELRRCLNGPNAGECIKNAKRTKGANN